MGHMHIDAVVRKNMDRPVVKWYQEDRITASDIQKSRITSKKEKTKKKIYL